MNTPPEQALARLDYGSTRNSKAAAEKAALRASDDANCRGTNKSYCAKCH